MAVERAKVAGTAERAPVKEEKEERRTLKPRSSKLERGGWWEIAALGEACRRRSASKSANRHPIRK